MTRTHVIDRSRTFLLRDQGEVFVFFPSTPMNFYSYQRTREGVKEYTVLVYLTLPLPLLLLIHILIHFQTEASKMDKAVHDLYRQNYADQQSVSATNDSSANSPEILADTTGQQLVGQQATKPITSADQESNPALHPN